MGERSAGIGLFGAGEGMAMSVSDFAVDLTAFAEADFRLLLHLAEEGLAGVCSGFFCQYRSVLVGDSGLGGVAVAVLDEQPRVFTTPFCPNKGELTLQLFTIE